MTVILNKRGECVLCMLRDYIRELERFIELYSDRMGDRKARELFEKFKRAWRELQEHIDEYYGLTYPIDL